MTAVARLEQRQRLGQLGLFDRRREVVDTVTQLVCAHYKVDVRLVRSHTRKRPYARLRMLVMWLSQFVALLSQCDVAHALGRDHSTVSHGVAEIEADLEFDPLLRRAVAALEPRIRVRVAKLAAPLAG